MTREEIQDNLKNLEQVQNFKKRLQKLKVNWETDLEQMNFSFLRSNPDCDIKNSRMDKINPITEFGDIKEAARDFLNDPFTYDLIEFIETGNKVIPPLYINPLEYDGQTFSTKETSNLFRVDGTHRVLVSSYLGLKEIPIIVHEKIVKYSFPVEKWDFEYSDESFTAISKNGEQRIRLDNRRVWIDNRMFSEDILAVSIS